jgi:hypothetical protein
MQSELRAEDLVLPENEKQTANRYAQSRQGKSVPVRIVIGQSHVSDLVPQVRVPPLDDNLGRRGRVLDDPRLANGRRIWGTTANLGRRAPVVKLQARPANSRVSVATFTFSPSLMKRGTRISRPVSSFTTFVTVPLEESPLTPGSA